MEAGSRAGRRACRSRVRNFLSFIGNRCLAAAAEVKGGALLEASRLGCFPSPPPSNFSLPPSHPRKHYYLRQGFWLKGSCLHESMSRCDDCICMWSEIMGLKHLRVERSLCDLSSTPSSEVRNQACSPGIQVLI